MMFYEDCPCGEDDCDRALDICADEKGARVSIHNGGVNFSGMPSGPGLAQTLVSFEGLKKLALQIAKHLAKTGHAPSIGDRVVEIRDYVRRRLDQPGRYVHIRFGIVDPLGQGKWDALLGANCGCTGGPLGKPSDTLEELYQSIVEDLDEVERRRAERDDV